MHGAHRDADATADAEGASDFAPDRVDGRNKVVEDLVGQVLVEHALLAEAPIVKLEGLRLHDARTRHVADRDLGEVGLAGGRTQAGELIGRKLDGVVPALLTIFAGSLK